ncbi:MAG TPA: MBL fold metallo-hydrolase [Acidimicrobiia bacterium]|nr:MBL fold metallo-hydrolase [Acidimicrobiia bacterium]
MVIVSHVHADHVAGLVDLVGRMGIGQVWDAGAPHDSPAYQELMGALSASGVPVVTPRVGESYALGELRLTVEGPLRRYASPNDQSLVVLVEGPGRSMLLAGDIEVIAQGELGHLRADVLKVPHQGADTSDPEWLVGLGAEVAVISVGPNEFGHPSPSVLDILEGAGVRVVRTDRQGDVVVPLS